MIQHGDSFFQEKTTLSSSKSSMVDGHKYPAASRLVTGHIYA